ncbi:MAG: M20/M25/M40 family metallo-hydrolase, partial [Terriglobales bacterium]
CVVVSDTAMFAPGIPALVMGLRGMLYSEITIEGAGRDLHSGLYGGVAPNPFEALVRVLADLKAPTGEILIPGFYDRVLPPNPEEQAAWGRLPFDVEAYRRDEVRAERLGGEGKFSVFERTWSRPTLDIHGMPGGFTGPGSKTVIPARASAKVSMRLVPDQRASEIEQQFQAAVLKLVPPGYRCSVQTLSLADPILVSAESEYVRAAQQALQSVYGAEPVLVRSGGSIPVVALFTHELRVPVVMMGFGLPDDGLHSPNEKFALSSYYGGIEAVAEFMGRLAQV